MVPVKSTHDKVPIENWEPAKWEVARWQWRPVVVHSAAHLVPSQILELVDLLPHMIGIAERLQFVLLELPWQW